MTKQPKKRAPQTIVVGSRHLDGQSLDGYSAEQIITTLNTVIEEICAQALVNVSDTSNNISINSDYDSYSVDIIVNVYRLETEQEVDARIAREQQQTKDRNRERREQRVKTEQRERALLAQLKAKYE